MRVFILALTAALGLLGTFPAAAQPADTPPTQTAAPSAEAPVTLPPPSAEAVRFYETGNILWIVDKCWDVLVPGLLLFTGFSARMRDQARRIGRKWFFVIALYWVLFLLVTYVIDWPLSFYAGFLRQHAYGLSNQTFGKWFGDSLKNLAVMAISGALFLWVPYLLLKKSPRRWWLYTGLLIYPFLAFVMFVMPVWVDPYFNKFQPMKDKALEGKILRLADSAGIEGSRVYEVNKSIDTKALNAYVTGFENTKRIVLWDTIIAALSEKELLFVMAHEMGHYVMGHVVKGIFFFGTLIFAGILFAHFAARGLLRRFGGRFRFQDLSDVASVPLFLVVFEVASLALDPVGFAYSRHMEREADRFGLELTQDNHAAAEAFVKLYSENLGYPNPGLLVRIWRSSHPPIADRVAFCNTYRPWATGAPLAYGALFHRTPPPDTPPDTPPPGPSKNSP